MKISLAAAGAAVAVLLSMSGVVGAASATTPSPGATSSPGVTPHSPILHPATTSDPGVAPGNDAWTSATSVEGYTNFTMSPLDTKDATTQSGEQRTLGNLDDFEVFNSVWVSWTAPANGLLEADTFSSPSSGWATDTTLAVFSGSSITKATRLAYNDDAGGTYGNLSQVRSVPIKAGVDYHFQVGISGNIGASPAAINDTAGYVALAVNVDYSAPSNDNFNSAKSESGSSWVVKGTTLGATIQKGEETDNPETSEPRLTSIWYKWTPAASGTISYTDTAVDSNAPGSTNQYYAIFQSSASSGALTEVAFSEGSLFAAQNFPIHAQSTYYFQLGQVATNAGGPVTLDVAATYTGPIVSKLSSTSGSHLGGKKITLTGTGLASVNYVCFGVGHCTSAITGVSATKLTVTTLAVPKGSYSIYVTTTGNERSNPNSHSEYRFT